jgi:DNA-binding transcriptional regulator YhcF (GntR family)
VWKLMADSGSRVKAGDPLLILEAMKMEFHVAAPHDGVVGTFPLQARYDDQRWRSFGLTRIIAPNRLEKHMVDTNTPAGPAKNASNLAAQIYTQLKADIFDFRLLPGDKFSEGDIATRMQVSRTPVRQALFWLQREGYVDVHFKSGWQVRAFDFKYFEDLYEVRVMMETTAIARIVALDAVDRLDTLR